MDDQLVQFGDLLMTKNPCPERLTALPMAVSELGYKARIVTKSNAGSILRASTYRPKLYNLLYSIKQCHAGVTGEEPFIKVREDGSYRTIFSCDLSKATDTIGHWVFNDFIDILGLPPECLLPEDPFLWTRGTPMGCPLGWSILSLINYYCGINADPTGQFVIKGDDLLAYWNKRNRSKYRELARLFGLVVKNERQGSFVGRDRGFYCERPFAINQDGEIRQLDGYVSLRLLVEDQPASGAKASITDAGLVKAQSLHKLVESVPRQVVFDLQKIVCGHILTLASIFKIDPYVPIIFGGLGLVPKDENDKPVDKYQRIAHWVHNHPSDDTLALVSKAYPKDSIEYNAAHRVQAYLNKVPYVVERKDKLLPCYDTEHIECRFAFHTVYFMLTGRKSCRPRLLSLFHAMKKRARFLSGKMPRRPPFLVNRTYKSMYELEKRIYPSRPYVELAMESLSVSTDGVKLMSITHDQVAALNERLLDDLAVNSVRF
jgi:hypothetical protein